VEKKENSTDKYTNNAIDDKSSKWPLIRIGQESSYGLHDLHLFLMREDAADDNVIESLFCVWR
jgi:hypothetical protein